MSKEHSRRRCLRATATADRTERTHCPAKEPSGEAVWFTQNMLLGTRQDMDDIVAAIRKLQAATGDLAKA